MQKIKLLLAITGGISAYKCVELARLALKEGFDIRILMTESACRLVGKATFQAVSHYPVASQLWIDSEQDKQQTITEAKQHGMLHIELAKWADYILVAPATANRLNKISQGIADDLLGSTLLATKAKIIVAPAMNVEMWQNSITQQSIQVLKQHNIHILGPTTGDQACGDTGIGRMLEPQELLDKLLKLSQANLSFKSILITVGATREPIDPVRFISNASSGRMGIELARYTHQLGIKTTLLHATVESNLLDSLPSDIQRISTPSAKNMLDQSLRLYKNHEVMIGCAAISDYRVSEIALQKIKKTQDSLTLDLVRNSDVIHTISHLDNSPFMVGFALETENILQHAQEKLQGKKLNLIIANDVKTIDSKTAKIDALWFEGQRLQHRLSSEQSKTEQADWIISLVDELYQRYQKKA